MRMGIHGKKMTSLSKDDRQPLITFEKDFGLVGTGKSSALNRIVNILDLPKFYFGTLDIIVPCLKACLNFV